MVGCLCLVVCPVLSAGESPGGARGADLVCQLVAPSFDPSPGLESGLLAVPHCIGVHRGVQVSFVKFITCQGREREIVRGEARDSGCRT